MAHATITFTAYNEEQLRTPAQINALFAAIKVVVDGKLDVRGGGVGANIEGPVTIINILDSSNMEKQP